MGGREGGSIDAYKFAISLGAAPGRCLRRLNPHLHLLLLQFRKHFHLNRLYRLLRSNNPNVLLGRNLLLLLLPPAKTNEQRKERKCYKRIVSYRIVSYRIVF